MTHPVFESSEPNLTPSFEFDANFGGTGRELPVSEVKEAASPVEVPKIELRGIELREAQLAKAQRDVAELCDNLLRQGNFD